LSAFSLPAPFSADELTSLQTSLRSANDDARKRLQRVETRERELAEWEHALEQRKGELEELRRLLEKRELELSMREEEVQRDANAKDAREQQSWTELARFFAEGDPAELATKLALFEPKDAVRILRALDDERAGALVNALPPDKYHAYLEAYRTSSKR
jgi:flagellar motility protein MotE (MotC chaperone)